MHMSFNDRVDATNVRITEDGYMVAEVPVARTGVYQYKASDVGLEGDHIVNVYRPEETVFSRDSLASYAGKPVTFLHPKENVDSKNWKKLSVGDIGNEIVRDGETVRVPIKIMDQAAINMVNSGVKQLSPGYSCEIEIKDGVTPDGIDYQAVQTGPLKINHLAIVPKARGGDSLLIDGAEGSEEWGASPVKVVNDSKPKEKKMSKTMLFDGMTIEVTDQAEQVINKLQKQLADAEAASQKTIADKDAEIATRDAKIDELKEQVLDDAALEAAVEERATVTSRAQAVVDGFDVAGKSLNDIRRQVVVAKLGDGMKDKHDAYIEARFDGLAEVAMKDKKESKKFDDALGKSTNTVDFSDARERADKAHANYIARMQGKEVSA